jgi:hypothetical protein
MPFSMHWLLAFAVAGCGDNLVPDAPVPSRVEVALVPVTPNRDVDLLFVIDNSPNFLDTQLGFLDAFPAFVDELAALPGGLPNLHIGVITSDLGTLGVLDTGPGPSLGWCVGSGDAGVLHTDAAVNGAFISDVAAADGSRVTNYTRALTDTFKLIGEVGSSGCAFAQHLAAAKRALDHNPANAGFLRDTAGLAIFVLTDDDDCSFMHSSFLDAADPALGPLATFRCPRFGVVCDYRGRTPDEMNVPGTKAGCRSNETSSYVMPVADYAAFFKSLKPDPRNVMMGVVSGDPSPFQVILASPGGGTPRPTVQPICSALDAEDPSIRLPELAHMFSHGVTETVCTPRLRPAQASFARHVRNLVGDSCLPRAIAMPPDCIVADQRADGSETLLPACGEGDCYELVADPECTASGLRVAVARSTAPPADTMVSVRCVL